MIVLLGVEVLSGSEILWVQDGLMFFGIGSTRVSVTFDFSWRQFISRGLVSMWTRDLLTIAINA